MHQVMILMGDRGIPDGYRKIHGYSGMFIPLSVDVHPADELLKDTG